MKTLLTVILFTSTILQLFSQEGSLINSFGNNGIALHGILSEDSELQDVILFNDFYYAVGSADVDIAEFLIIKTDLAGNLVSSFGTGGYLSLPKGSGSSEFTKIELSNDGQLLASGWMRDGNNEVAVIIKFNESGVLDNTFSDDGIAEIRIANSSFGEDRVTNLILKADRIYFSSPSYTGSKDVIGIACLENDGSFCSEFGNEGKKNIEISDAIGSYGARVMIEHPQGGFVIAGGVKFDFFDENSLYLLKTDNLGTVDLSFGVNGLTIFSLGEDIKTGVNDLIIDSENKIVTGGGAFNDQELDNNFFISRFNLDGTLDTGFGNNGTNVLALNANESISDLLLDLSGNIVAAGSTGGFPSNLMLARYSSDGQLDNSFGTNGYTITSVTNDFNGLSGIDFGPNGEIIAAGFSKLNSRRALLALYDNSFSSSATDVNNMIQFSIFPNPTLDKLELEYNSKSNENLVAMVLDMSGRLLLSQKFDVKVGINNLKIEDVGSLAPNQYMLTIRSESGILSTRYFSKN